MSAIPIGEYGVPRIPIQCEMNLEEQQMSTLQIFGNRYLLKPMTNINGNSYKQ